MYGIYSLSIEIGPGARIGVRCQPALVILAITAAIIVIVTAASICDHCRNHNYVYPRRHYNYASIVIMITATILTMITIANIVIITAAAIIMIIAANSFVYMTRNIYI